MDKILAILTYYQKNKRQFFFYKKLKQFAFWTLL